MSDSRPPASNVLPSGEIAGDDAEDTHLLNLMAAEARDFLSGFRWCQGVRELYFGGGVGGLAAVFLARISPARPDVDEWLWVIFGDVPPAYLVTDQCSKGSEALKVYVVEMRKWVELARRGRASREVIPVYLPATPENAQQVETVLIGVEELVIPYVVAWEAEVYAAHG